MEKYFITGDLEKTLPGGVDFLNNEKISIDKSIRNELLSIIDNSFDKNVVEFIKYDDVCNYFLELKKEDEFIVSLEDGIYIPDADYNFSSTRTYDNKESILNDPKKYKILQRNGLKLDFQDKELLGKIEASGKKEIIICDDGLFSGDTIMDVVKNMKELGIKIKEIRVILNFTNQLNLDGIPITSMYQDNSCIDWLDERDLFYGSKNGGASFFKNNNLNGLTYISNSIIASKKASIPENKSKGFCNNMIDLNKDVWKELERINEKTIRLANLPRISYLLDEYDRNLSITEILNLERNNI